VDTVNNATQNIQLIWQEAQQLLKTKVGDTVFQTWILPLKAKERRGSTCVLEAPDAFFRDWVDRHYKPLIQDALVHFLKESVELVLEVSAAGHELPQKIKEEAAARPRSAENQPNLSLNPRYTFDNFVVGSSNKHAHAYSLAVA
jgi:chromosomal replication initiator protein